MIELYDSQIVQILPEYLSSNPEVKALSYAISQAIKNALDYARQTSVYASIDSASDTVLDMLAVELGTQYYNSSLPIENKRKLIKNTLIWYASSGTKSAVEELADSIFGGSSDLEEWFEYDGAPGTFRLYVDISDSNINSIHDYDVEDMRIRMLQSKRLSAHLESISYMVRHSIQIKKETEGWIYRTPESGTLYCGTHWMPSTIGYSHNPEINISAKPDGYIYEVDHSGTKPIVSAKGYSVKGTEELSGRADLYNAYPVESGIANAGTMPNIVPKGFSSNDPVLLGAGADAFIVIPVQSGTKYCGTINE